MINNGIIGIRILKKYFVIVSKTIDTLLITSFFRTAPKELTRRPATNPAKRAVSFEMIFGSFNENICGSSLVDTRYPPMALIHSIFKKAKLEKYDKVVFMKFEQQIRGIIMRMNLKELPPRRVTAL
jgi:hypothetical protein